MQHIQAVETGSWELPPTSLPDANTWPTWSALRERILMATKQINILGSAAVRDAFIAELVKLSPPELHTLVRLLAPPCMYCTALSNVPAHILPDGQGLHIQSRTLSFCCTPISKALIAMLQNAVHNALWSIVLLSVYSSASTCVRILASSACCNQYYSAFLACQRTALAAYWCPVTKYASIRIAFKV